MNKTGKNGGTIARLGKKQIRIGLYDRAFRQRLGKRTGYLAYRLIHRTPWLEVADLPVVRAFCRAEIIAQRAFEALHDPITCEPRILNDLKEPRRLFGEFLRANALVGKLGDRLGFTPMARAAMNAGSEPGRRTDPLAALANVTPDSTSTQASDTTD